MEKWMTAKLALQNAHIKLAMAMPRFMLFKTLELSIY